MVTKNTPTMPGNRPIPDQKHKVLGDLQKSDRSGGNAMGQDYRNNNVFQTRPTPPDPNKK